VGLLRMALQVGIPPHLEVIEEERGTGGEKPIEVIFSPASSARGARAGRPLGDPSSPGEPAMTRIGGAEGVKPAGAATSAVPVEWGEPGVRAGPSGASTGMSPAKEGGMSGEEEPVGGTPSPGLTSRMGRNGSGGRVW
jgi:hypothetical protein